jgi:hypothetical protein
MRWDTGTSPPSGTRAVATNASASTIAPAGQPPGAGLRVDGVERLTARFGATRQPPGRGRALLARGRGRRVHADEGETEAVGARPGRLRDAVGAPALAYTDEASAEITQSARETSDVPTGSLPGAAPGRRRACDGRPLPRPSASSPKISQSSASRSASGLLCSSGIRKTSPKNTPRKVPLSTPAPTRSISCLTLSLEPSADQVTTAASRILTRPPFRRDSSAVPTPSAPSADRNLHTVGVDMVPSPTKQADA